MDQNEMVLRLACAILPGLMERRRENSYTDYGAIHEAFRLSQDWFCHQIEPTAKAVEAGATVAAGEPSAAQHGQLAICAIAVSYCPSAINSVEKTECSYDKECPHKQQA